MLWGWMSEEVQLSLEANNFPLPQNLQVDFGDHSASYVIGSSGFLPGNKEAGSMKMTT
jgi:hypothetical protein